MKKQESQSNINGLGFDLNRVWTLSSFRNLHQISLHRKLLFTKTIVLTLLKEDCVKQNLKIHRRLLKIHLGIFCTDHFPQYMRTISKGEWFPLSGVNNLCGSYLPRKTAFYAILVGKRFRHKIVVNCLKLNAVENLQKQSCHASRFPT